MYENCVLNLKLRSYIPILLYWSIVTYCVQLSFVHATLVIIICHLRKWCCVMGFCFEALGLELGRDVTTSNIQLVAA